MLDRLSQRLTPVATGVTVAVVALTLAACFDDPVREELTLSFEPGDSMTVRYRVHVTRDVSFADREAFATRLAELELALVDGTHPWLDRLERLDASRDGLSWERDDGVLTSFERWARAPRIGLDRLLGDTAIQAAATTDGGVTELALFAGPGGSATAAEQALVERARRKFVADLTGYLEATVALWRHIEANPHRAEACLTALFSDLIEGEPEVELTPLEQRLLERSEEAESAVVEIFDAPDEMAISWQELSRRVYDPFPARFVVERPPGSELLEVEGFRVATEGRLRVQSVSFFDALQSLAGRWVSPDPLMAKLAHLRAAPDESFVLDGFLDRDFAYVAPAPSQAEIENDVEAALRPLSQYRAVWREPERPTFWERLERRRHG